MVHASIIMDTQGYRHTLRICNTYCFSTATMVTQTRLSIAIIRTLPTFFIWYIQFINLPKSLRRLNPLNPELNPICYLLALLLAHHFIHVSGIRVKLLTFRLLMSYIYMEHPFLTFLDHTQRRSTVGRTPLDE